VGGQIPTYVVDDYCGATRSYGIGLAGIWLPSEAAPWLGIETEAQYVTAPIDFCAIPDLLPEGERLVIETDLRTPFGAVSGRLLLHLPFGPGQLRFHAGGGFSVPGAQPIVSRGVGVAARRGRLSASAVLDWWTLWPGGDRFREEWDMEGTRREHLGSFEDWFHVRFFRLSLGWDVGGE
jgi:hypothetical protein